MWTTAFSASCDNSRISPERPRLGIRGLRPSPLPVLPALPHLRPVCPRHSPVPEPTAPLPCTAPPSHPLGGACGISQLQKLWSSAGRATCGVSPDPWHWPSPEHRPLLLAGNPRASPLDQDLGGEVKIMTVKAVGEAWGGEGQEEAAAGGGEPRAPRPGLRSWSTCGQSQPRPRSHLTADRLRVTSRLGVRFLTCDMAVALDSVGFYSCLSCKTDTEGKGSKEGLREDRAGGKAPPERGALG